VNKVTSLKRIALPGALLVAAIGLAGCEVEKTQEGEMPDVSVEGGQMPEYEQTREGRMPDVDVQGGQMPRYDVDAPDVDVGTKEKTVTVPDVDINMPADRDDANEPVQAGQDDPGRPTP
jgi:hypothetical protein